MEQYASINRSTRQIKAVPEEEPCRAARGRLGDADTNCEQINSCVCGSRTKHTKRKDKMARKVASGSAERIECIEGVGKVYSLESLRDATSSYSTRQMPSKSISTSAALGLTRPERGIKRNVLVYPDGQFPKYCQCRWCHRDKSENTR